MTDLSPAAQGVKDAVLALYSDESVHKFGWQLDAPTVAVALRAAAGYLFPNDTAKQCYDRLLAIATELEGK